MVSGLGVDGRWIGRRGTNKRPPIRNFFVCVSTRQKVYRSKPRTPDDLGQVIRQTFAYVPLDFLMKSVGCLSSGSHKFAQNVGGLQ